MAEQSLTHHGVQGMKWGVRRYQPYGKGESGRFLGKTSGKAKTPKKQKATFNKGVVDGKTLADEVIDNLGIVAVSSLAGGYLVSKGQVEVGDFISTMGNIAASGSMLADIINRVDPVKK